MPVALPQKGCAHCGEPVGEGGGSFCCNGCERVHGLLMEEGLERFYALSGDRVDRADEPAAVDAVALERLQEEGASRLDLGLSGMHCAACVWLIRQVYLRQPGARQLRVDSVRGRVSMEMDPSSFSLLQFADELAGFGYGLRASTAQVEGGSRWWLPGLSIALTMNIMLLTLPLYFGLEPGEQTFALMTGVAALLTGVQVLVCGRGLFAQAWRAARFGLAHLDQPLALGIGTGFIASLIALSMGRPEGLYFDSVSMLLTFILVGRALQADRLDAVRRAVDEPVAPVQWSVRRMRNGSSRAVALDELIPGDVFLLPSGGLVPVRSTLLGDESARFDPSWITGESEPSTVGPGASVPSGYRLIDHTGLRLRACESWEAASLNELLNIPSVGLDEGEQPEWLRRFVRWFVPSVVVLAVTAGGLWAWRAGPEIGLEVLVAVLVVSCPCTLALGLPLARRLAAAAMAQRGWLVRSERFFAALPRLRHLVFDKTGTITRSGLSLDQPEQLTRLLPRHRQVLATMVASSAHPRSVAIGEALGALTLLTGAAVTEHPGSGLELRSGDQCFRLGRPQFAEPKGDPGRGETVFSLNGQALARLTFAEVMSEADRRALEVLRRDGYGLGLLSGDDQSRVDALVRKYGLPVDQALGGLSPRDKAEALPVSGALFCGDGVNDLPAMERAELSCSLAGDQPVVPSRCDLLVSRGGVAGLVAALDLGFAADRAGRRLLTAGLAYNLLVIALAVAGWMRPWLAAAVMPLSSVVVVMSLLAWHRRLSGKGAL